MIGLKKLTAASKRHSEYESQSICLSRQIRHQDVANDPETDLTIILGDQ